MAAMLADVARASPDSPLLVGFSGGLDSTVLLHLLASDERVLARGLRAIHVRHDLQPAAAAWEAHCVRVCGQLKVPLVVVSVKVQRDSGLGLEAAAREARHAAFAAQLRAAETLVLAHHRDDQAETVLLRLLRASSSEGLAAMRGLRDFGRGSLWRPLLDIPREQLLRHARACKLAWIEDPSNQDTRHDRNFLRHRVLPLLDERWPGAAAALSRSAQLLREDATLLEEEVERRLLAVASDDPALIDADKLMQWSAPWRARVLRHWFKTLGLPSPPGRAFERIDPEILGARPDALPELRWAGMRLERWRGCLHVERVQPPLPSDFECAWDGQAPLQLPGGDWLEIGLGGGPCKLPALVSPLRVRARRGGERIHLAGRSHSHALKDCLQRAWMPPWRRRRLPLLFAPDDELLAAGDVIYSGRWQRDVASHTIWLSWRQAGRD